MATPQLTTTAEVAKRLRVSPPTVRAMLARGDLRGHRVGAHIRIDAESVEEYLERRRIA